MKNRDSICLLLLLFLGTTKADIALQENLDQIAFKVNFRLEMCLNLNEMAFFSGGGQGGGVQGEVLRGLPQPGQYCLLALLQQNFSL